jgi:hypothetical protein
LEKLIKFKDLIKLLMGFMDSIKDLIEEKSSLERLHQDWVINTPWELHEKKFTIFILYYIYIFRASLSRILLYFLSLKKILI